MSRLLPVLGSILLLAGPAHGNGLLIPSEKKVPPLALLTQQVSVSIEDQVAVTRVEQVFRNHTANDLEATYVFPVPKGASVREFAMWVNDKKMSGQLMQADEARKIYTEIVQRTQDPGLLEYLEGNLFRLKVFPVPANGDQKIALSYTSVAESDHGTIEYRYPLKTDAKALETLEKFSLNVELKSQHRLQSIYSPSHAVTIARAGDREARVSFENRQTLLNKDFQLYYTTGDKDVGLTALTQRPYESRDGAFMLLISPRAELSKEQQVPRDLVFVLDTSGSMAGKRIVQARNALKFCLSNLNENDRFAVLHFANTVNKHNDTLEPATADNIDNARKWVERLEATGGTAIQAALAAALEMRPRTQERTFTVVFFTDGRPTVGETDAKRIQENILGKNTTNTRIFTFGVGDDVNATLLDMLAEHSRAMSTYVRETEDIEERVSSFYSKINHPVFANLRLTAGKEIKLSEVYPPELPDLFHGSQLVVLGRYSGSGDTTLKLSGNLGKHEREFTYELTFPKQTKEDKTFVEDLWARRKVGFLLDQIRRNGEVAELKDEVIRLAKRHGITTPYTSFLVTPDEAVAGNGERKEKRFNVPDVRFHLQPNSPLPVPGQQPAVGLPGPGNGLIGGGYPGYGDFTGFTGVSGMMGMGGGFGVTRLNPYMNPGTGVTYKLDPKNPPKVDPKDPPKAIAPIITDGILNTIGASGNADPKAKEPNTKGSATAPADPKEYLLNKVGKAFAEGRLADLDSGTLAVDLAVYLRNLRTDNQVEQAPLKTVNGRTCLQVGNIWIDEDFNDKVATISVKGLSKAYFRILERQPRMREVFALGNALIWITPSGTALIIDLNSGRDDMPDEEIDRLFAESTKK